MKEICFLVLEPKNCTAFSFREESGRFVFLYLSHSKWASKRASEGAQDKVKAGTYKALCVCLHKLRILPKYVCQGNLLKRMVGGFIYPVVFSQRHSEIAVPSCLHQVSIKNRSSWPINILLCWRWSSSEVDCPSVTKIDVETPLSSLGLMVDIISV